MNNEFLYEKDKKKNKIKKKTSKDLCIKQRFLTIKNHLEIISFFALYAKHVYLENSLNDDLISKIQLPKVFLGCQFH